MTQIPSNQTETPSSNDRNLTSTCGTNPGAGRLLVVDDDASLRRVLALYLQNRGYSIREAENGRKGLYLLEHHSIDLVLLDIQMPELNGVDVLKAVRKKWSSIELPVIMLTGVRETGQIVELLEQGANDYVAKPFDFAVVNARVQTHLLRKHSHEALQESEERYARAARAANDGLWDWNLQSMKIDFSPRWKSMLGFSELEIGQDPDEWFSRLHPEDAPRVQADLRAHLTGETTHFENEYRVMHRDGSYRWMICRGLATRGSSGHAIRMAGSQTDITAGKVADGLTGLPNRVLFLDRLSRCMERAKRDTEYGFAVLFLDLDGFKLVNDSLGHTTGDQLLIAIARRLESCLRASDSVSHFAGQHTFARLGGDEFTILLEGIRQADLAIKIAERIQQELAHPFELGGHEVFCTASVGVALHTSGYDCPEEILRDADTAMYHAKARGKSRCSVFDPSMRDRVVARLQLETDLRKALEQHELQVFYQPIVSLETNSIFGLEALVRWQHPTRGLMLPTEFIPLAEETGLIIPIGQWILGQACRQVQDWNEKFPDTPPLTLSINVSSKQFLKADLAERIEQTLNETGMPAELLNLEITESVLMQDTESAALLMRQLKKLNVGLGLDDFGTGYSSLSYLHRFPMDLLKVDHSFVGQMGTDTESAAIVRTILTLADHLGLTVIAEGVETIEQVEALLALRCKYAQGHLFSQPLDCSSVEALLSRLHNTSDLAFLPGKISRRS